MSPTRSRLHPLAVEDALNAHQRPKLDRYDDSLFLDLAHALVRRRGRRGRDRRDQHVRRHALRRDRAARRGLRAAHPAHRPRGDAKVLGHGPSAVVYAVCDRVVDDYEAVAASLQEDVDEVESSVFSPERTDDSVRIYILKREMAEMRRAVLPLKEPMRQLGEGQVEGHRPRGQAVLPRRLRPRCAHGRGDRRARQPADGGVPGAPGPHLGAAERGHAQDLRGRRAGRRTDADRRRLRHELRPHAGAALAVRLRLRAGADGRDRRGRSGCSSRSPAGSRSLAHEAGGGWRKRSSSQIRACPRKPATSCTRRPRASWVRSKAWL